MTINNAFVLPVILEKFVKKVSGLFDIKIPSKNGNIGNCTIY